MDNDEEEKRYVGIDIGKSRCRACIIDKKGFVVDEFNFENSHDGIDSLIAKLCIYDRVVMESTGNLWVNIYDKLEADGIQCTLANPMKTKAIASARIKS
ncbi:MAG: transposase, partial [Nitrososphaerales archaeon]